MLYCSDTEQYYEIGYSGKVMAGELFLHGLMRQVYDREIVAENNHLELLLTALLGPVTIQPVLTYPYTVVGFASFLLFTVIVIYVTLLLRRANVP